MFYIIDRLALKVLARGMYDSNCFNSEKRREESKSIDLTGE